LFAIDPVRAPILAARYDVVPTDIQQRSPSYDQKLLAVIQRTFEKMAARRSIVRPRDLWDTL
ncbi:hypothetical protein AAVH_12099, partial [Aphelenchoides avenae]